MSCLQNLEELRFPCSGASSLTCAITELRMKMVPVEEIGTGQSTHNSTNSDAAKPTSHCLVLGHVAAGKGDFPISKTTDSCYRDRESHLVLPRHCMRCWIQCKGMGRSCPVPESHPCLAAGRLASHFSWEAHPAQPSHPAHCV